MKRTSGRSREQQADQEIAVGDVVRFDEPYSPSDGGTYTHGIVSELVGVTSEGPRPESVAVYPFNPKTQTYFTREERSLGPVVPEKVDHPTDNLTRVNKGEAGYTSLDPEMDRTHEAVRSFVSDLPGDEWAMWHQSLAPLVESLREQDVVSESYFNPGAADLREPAPVVVVNKGHPEKVALLHATAENIGWSWEQADQWESEDVTAYKFFTNEHRRLAGDA